MLLRFLLLLQVGWMWFGALNAQSGVDILQPDSVRSIAAEMMQKYEYASAMEKYLELDRYAEEVGDHLLRTQVSLALVNCNYYLYDKKASLKWCYEALRNSKLCGVDSLSAQANYLTGAMYIEASQVDSAMKYCNNAITFYQRINDYKHLAQVYCVLSEMLMNNGAVYSKWQEVMTEAERYAELSQNPYMIAFAAMKRFNYNYYILKDYQEALKHINRAEQFYSSTGNREGILNAYRAKAECLIMLRDTSARMYMNEWFAFKDSILQADKAANIAKYETMYETNKKDKENRLLEAKNERQRLWLVSAIFGMLALSVIAVLVVRTRNQRVEKLKLESALLETQAAEAMNKEKERISRDLHDNVGAHLSYLISNLDWIREHPDKINDNREFQSIMSRLGDSGRNAMMTLRETIWAISHKELKMQEFVDRFKQYVLKMTEIRADLNVVFSEELLTDPSLSPAFTLNLFRICQEAFHNAIQHSGCSEIQIVFFANDTRIRIGMNDNGKGFDPESENKDHYGLVNMRARAAEVGAQLIIDSRQNAGTRLLLVCELNRDHLHTASDVLSGPVN